MTFTARLSKGLTFVGGSGCKRVKKTQVIRCTAKTAKPGWKHFVTIKVRVTKARKPAKATIFATVYAGTPDPKLSNNKVIVARRPR